MHVVLFAIALGGCHAIHHDSSAGQRLYDMHCAGCHGLDGRGDGAYRPYLKVPPPDLTRMASRHGGTLDDEEVFRIIDGQSLDHFSSRHMPVWGFELYGDEPDDRQAHETAARQVRQLVGYIMTLQQK